MSRPPRTSDYPALFDHELSAAKRGQPTVSMPYLRGVKNRATVCVLPSLKAALHKHAPGCSTTALIALADLGLRELLAMKPKQTLHSHVVVDRHGGDLIHILTLTEPGLKAAYCGRVPGPASHFMVSMPGPLGDALKRHTSGLWTGAMALADWQLKRLIQDKVQLTSTPTGAITAEAKLPDGDRRR